METITHTQLTRAAGYFSEHPAFCGSLLRAYRDREGLTEAALAARLGCSAEQLAHLALCFYPRAEQWDADVADLAEEYGCDAAALAAALAEG